MDCLRRATSTEHLDSAPDPWLFKLLSCSLSTTGLALRFVQVCHNSDDLFKAEYFIVETKVSYGPGLPQEVRRVKQWSCLDFVI